MSTRKPDSLVRPIDLSEQSARKWEVKIDGKLIEAPSLVEIGSPRFGRLHYGWLPQGYDGWSFREPGGGGAVSVPYALKNDELLIGVAEQLRPNQGGQVLNVPRGFLEAGETHDHTAKRELSEETGLDPSSLYELAGAPLNANSAFFETPEPELGVRIYALEVPGEWLVPAGDHFQLGDGAHMTGVEASREARLQEGIGKLRFIRWADAARLADMFSVAAVARLIAALHHKDLWRPA